MMKKYKIILIHALASSIIILATCFMLFKYFNYVNYIKFEKESSNIKRALDDYLFNSDKFTIIKSFKLTVPKVKTNLIKKKSNVQVINKKLEIIKKEFSLPVVYILDEFGKVIASSTVGDSKINIIGKNYNFRPYYKDAMKGNEGIYAAIGVTTHKRGLYYYSPIRELFGDVNSKIIGVMVLNVSLHELDLFHLKSINPQAIISSLGVVFSTTNPDWLLKSLTIISKEKKEKLQFSRQFADFLNSDIPTIDISYESNGKFVTFNSKRYAYKKLELGIEDEFGKWSFITTKETSTWYSLWPFFVYTFYSLLIYYLIVIIVLKIKQRNSVLNDLEKSERKLTGLSMDLLSKNKELQQQQKELLEMERLKALNAIIVTYNHEINNPLTIINGCVSEIRREDTTNVSDITLNNINDAVKRISKIIKSIEQLTKSKDINYQEYGKGIDMINLESTSSKDKK